jgi:hypothetical protein
MYTEGEVQSSKRKYISVSFVFRIQTIFLKETASTQ